jgi:hypothetical protein
MSSQSYEIKTESTEATKNYTQDKPWVYTRKLYKYRNLGKNYAIEIRKANGKGELIRKMLRFRENALPKKLITQRKYLNIK